VEEAVAEAAGAFIGVGHFGHLEEFFVAFAEMDFDGFFLFGAANSEA
jgi:hypothetical protein